METVFIKLLNRSIAAGWLVLAVVILRLLLKKAPKWINCALWALVGIRLVFPFSIESVFSLIPSAETVPQSALTGDLATADSGISAIDTPVNGFLGNHDYEAVAVPAGTAPNAAGVLAMLWLVGIAALLIYTLVSYFRLRRRVGTAVLLRDNIWQSENVASPFVLGLFRPRIYLPFGMREADTAYVAAHERAHIRRRDHWIKPIGFLILTVYWFHPLLWLAYLLLCRDIELACDERAIREWSADERAGYSSALLSCSAGRRMIAACPLAFGEVGVKQRVKNVLNYRKPAFWVIVVTVISCIVVAVCFLTNPKEEQDLSFLNYENLVTLAAQSDTLPAHVSEQSDEADDTVDGHDLAVFLDHAVWSPQRGILRSVQRETEKESTASIQIQFSEDVWMRIFDTDTVYVYSNGRGRYYRARSGDYEKALALIGSSDRSNDTGGNRILTLNDVAALSQKGEALSWGDFDPYSHIETGSGLYIRVYEINPLFSLWIGGGATSEKPMYIRLKADTGADDDIDIRTDDVTAFISAHKDDLLDIAVSAAILEHNRNGHSDRDFACESHVTLATLPGERWDADSDSMIQTVEVYLMALYQEYQYTDSGFSNTRGSHIPCVLTFDDTKTGYTLTNYWEPRDGSYYKPDIEKRFRGLDATTIADALDTQKFIVAQIQSCYAQAAEYGKIDTDAVIGKLFEGLASQSGISSADELPDTTRRELTYYGDYTLRYIFSEFLRGGQTGYQGQLMRIVMDELIGGEAIKTSAATGQEYFDAWLALARQAEGRNGDEYLQAHTPKAWLLLHMIGE